jgi:hypothetical protein
MGSDDFGFDLFSPNLNFAAFMETLRDGSVPAVPTTTLQPAGPMSSVTAPPTFSLDQASVLVALAAGGEIDYGKLDFSKLSDKDRAAVMTRLFAGLGTRATGDGAMCDGCFFVEGLIAS